MTRKNCHRILVVCLNIYFCFSINDASGEEFGFRDGHLYAVIEGGIQEYDADLNKVASKIFGDISVTEGVAFNSSGNLIFSALRLNADQKRTHHVIEMNSSGMIINDLDLQIFSFARAYHIDIDDNGNVYVASNDGIIEIASDFGSHRLLSHDFDRASGVVVGPDNKLYVSDQLADDLVIFDANRNFEDCFYIGNIPVGLEFNGNGKLLASIFGPGELREIDVDSQTTSLILGGLHNISDISFTSHGDFYVSLERGREIWGFRSDLSVFSTAKTGEFSDSIVVYEIPYCDIVAHDFDVIQGNHISGDLKDTFASDDSYFKVQPTTPLPPVWIEFDGTLPSDSPTSLAVTLEAHANTPGLTQTIDMFNWNTGEYEEVDAQAASFNQDSVVTVDVTGDIGSRTANIADYVESGTGAVRTRVGWRATGFVLLFPWTICIDQVVWTVNE